ncbi:MAG: tRNA (guanosine(37)-N1)-methyltransferase TrmD [Candidatus Uhrbacteria bacterium]
MKIDIITIFPEVVTPYVNAAMLKRAQTKRLARFDVHDLRKWAPGKHRNVDDKPFGGGAGMVMMVEPIYRALRALRCVQRPASSVPRRRTRVLLMSAKGKPFTQRDAERYAKKYNRLVLICGRYEGVDERVAKHLADEEVCVGPYVLTGGELPALTIVDAVTRLIPGVLGDPESLEDESFGELHSQLSNIKYQLGVPAYTRPADFSPKRGVHWRVPKILLEGDHKKIDAWRKIRRS